MFCIFCIGTAGYVLIEDHWTFMEAAYMSVVTIFTVGFKEVRPLSPPGQLFTMAIIITGVGTAVYAGGKAVELIVEGELAGYQKRKRMEKKIRELKDHFIICGFGRVGHQVAETFQSSGIPYVVIDDKKESSDELEKIGAPGITGDATSDSILSYAGIGEAKGLVACADSDVVNVFVTLSARALNPDLFIVARAGIKDTEKKLMMAGANRVISPYFISGIRMAALATRPVTSDFLDIVTHGGNLDFKLFEITIPQNSRFVNKTIEESNIRNTSGIAILAIRKADGSFDLQPKATSKIDTNDVMVLIGTQEQFEQLEKMM
ncbi:MAG: potassium channel protein [Acidobacteria bacterium]|nr:potassium channel protein [Acidobacteriota bacterium]